MLHSDKLLATLAIYAVSAAFGRRRNNNSEQTRLHKNRQRDCRMLGHRSDGLCASGKEDNIHPLAVTRTDEISDE